MPSGTKAVCFSCPGPCCPHLRQSQLSLPHPTLAMAGSPPQPASQLQTRPQQALACTQHLVQTTQVLKPAPVQPANRQSSQVPEHTRAAQRLCLLL